MAVAGNTQADEAGKADTTRIAKVIARSGLCSRREAEGLIASGRVTVNGKTIDSPALNVQPDDTILVDGAALQQREPPRLWRYHKPKGRVTTHKDPEGRRTVFDGLPEDLPRLISVGRLDYNTEGLLLLTNDGALARHLELPATGWARRYRVRAHGDVEQAALDGLANGITIDGIHYGPVEAALERKQGSNVWIAVTLREGKNREIRRIMEHLGLTVNRLIRVSYGPFMLGELEPGQVEEIKPRILMDQLGPEKTAELAIQPGARGPRASHPVIRRKLEASGRLTRRASNLGAAPRDRSTARLAPEPSSAARNYKDRANRAFEKPAEAPPPKLRRILPMDAASGVHPVIEEAPERPRKKPRGFAAQNAGTEMKKRGRPETMRGQEGGVPQRPRFKAGDANEAQRRSSGVRQDGKRGTGAKAGVGGGRKPSPAARNAKPQGPAGRGNGKGASGPRR